MNSQCMPMSSMPMSSMHMSSMPMSSIVQPMLQGPRTARAMSADGLRPVSTSRNLPGMHPQQYSLPPGTAMHAGVYDHGMFAGGVPVGGIPVPMAAAGVDTNHDGRANYVCVGPDLNRDGIPDALQRPMSSMPMSSIGQPMLQGPCTARAMSADGLRPLSTSRNLPGMQDWSPKQYS